LDLVRVHKKIAEAQFFLWQMIWQERQIAGDRRPFDYYLSAFLSAAMSVRGGFHYRQDRARNDAIKAWRAQWERNLTAEEKDLYEFMRKDRVAEVHDSGSRRSEAQEDITLTPGMKYWDQDMGMVTVGGRPDRPPALIRKQTYNFTIDGVEQRATEACAAYLALLQRMVAKFEADHP
jgi:hypothetical protein